MKQMVCEMCGSTDLVKQDGMFVCQVCGTKYSVEDAKKMMIEGTVDVQGTVTVDNSSFVERYLANARRAKQKEDWEEVEKYYNLVEQNDPTNIEAIFYSAYGKAKMSMVESDIYKRQQICDVFCNSISVVDDNYDVSESEENIKIVQQMHDDLINMYGTSFVYTQVKDGYGNVTSTNANETYSLFGKMALSFIESVENIIKVDEHIEYWKIIYQQYKFLVINPGITVQARNQFREKALELGKKIHEQDPSFEVEEIAEQKAPSGGCYVATAVYGSYDCPEVWTLRRYRDYKLAETWYGRAFIRTYYAISPTLVKWFGETEWFKRIWKGKLDRMVTDLQNRGFEATPYEDQEW